LALFEGRHDFEAFGARRGYETEETSYTRTVTRVEMEEIGWGWRLRYRGEGFLYKMVRLMTGAAVQAAQGKLRVDQVAALLDQPAGLPLGKCSHCAPPDGLFLESVDYGG
jgi:tRNA pseudouridine38-40 synthase